ncbi:unnamed protein product [Oikopleura dioica]|uniref:Uncharacterized protein n=1 Tax=Oikopleura dioica TaxID=34765 RepID=E4YPK3_OIKDI|nr:unnamed protein product [Oikopleura dioica]
MTRGRMDASGAQFCATKRLEFESDEPKINLDGNQYSLANTDRAVLWGITSNGGSTNAQGVKTGCGDATGDSTGG